MDTLRAHEWPGNVRELENTMHRAVLLAQSSVIEPGAIMLTGGRGIPVSALQPQATAAAAPANAKAAAASGVTSALVGRTVAAVERDLIIDTLQHCLGNRTHAANILGISIRTLRNKLNEYADGGIPITPAGSGEHQRFATAG